MDRMKSSGQALWTILTSKVIWSVILFTSVGFAIGRAFEGMVTHSEFESTAAWTIIGAFVGVAIGLFLDTWQRSESRGPFQFGLTSLLASVTVAAILSATVLPAAIQWINAWRMRNDYDQPRPPINPLVVELFQPERPPS